MADPVAPSLVQLRRRGYERLAAIMAWDPGLAMIPRFRAANIFTLLCLQAEIRDIEEQLEVQIRRDNQSQGHEKLYSCNLDILTTHGIDSPQWKLVLQLRSKLEEYNRMAIQQITIGDQPSPCQYDYALLHEWMDSPHGGARDLRGAGAVAFLKAEHGGCVADNLFALGKKNGRSDHFRRLCNDALKHVLKCFPFLRLKHQTLFPEENFNRYKMYGTSEIMAQIGDRIATMLAAVLMLVPVIVLHFVTSPTDRLLLIVAFTLIFTASMALFADGKRADVFAAVAAFVAVQVVYVGSVAPARVQGP